MDGRRQRESIVDALRGAPEGLDTGALAEIVGLHANTVRWHLGRLAEEGFVRSAPEQRGARGRPRIVHRVTPDGIASGRDEYRLLATMLTSVVASDPEGDERAYSTGVRWGRDISATEPGAGVAFLLDREGFAAEEVDGRIEMRRCPFYALAESNPGVVCSLHRGIIDGALEEMGAEQRVDRLDAFVEPTLCVARLRASAAPTRARRL